MVKIIRQGVYYTEGRLVKETQAFMTSDKKEIAVRNTVVSKILSAHGSREDVRADGVLAFDFSDGLRTADACGVREFAVPAVLFGEEGTDMAFCLSAAQKFGADHVPLSLATPCQYALERVAKSGAVYFSDEALPVGALGALSFLMGEGTLLRTLTKEGKVPADCPVVALKFRGKLRKGVGPTDVALAIIRACVAAGQFAQGKILEVLGAGDLSVDFRTALDGALRYSGCCATVWATDGKTEEYFRVHGREGDFKPLSPVQPAYYDGAIVADLSKIEPMIEEDGEISTVREYLEANGETKLDHAVIAEDAATYETVAEVAELLEGKQLGCSFSLGVLFPSAAVERAAVAGGYFAVLGDAGAVFCETDGCGTQAWAGDFEEGGLGLDARTIAASAANGGMLTSALGLGGTKRIKKYAFREEPYRRVYHGTGAPKREVPLCYDGEDFTPIPALAALPEDLELSFGEEGERYAAVLRSEGETDWGDAIRFRENGGAAVIAKGFSARERTHLIDWGILPLTAQKLDFRGGDKLVLSGIAQAVREGQEQLIARVVGKRKTREVALTLGALTAEEKKILLAGGKINTVKGKKNRA